jgi:hypothetical protein
VATLLTLLLLTLTIAAPCGMISVASEQLITLAQLATRIPHRRNGRPVHPSTPHRWRCPGIQGIRLECIRVGGAWHTSVEAFQRFCEALTRVADPKAAGSQGRRKGRDEKQIERELDELGI